MLKGKCHVKFGDFDIEDPVPGPSEKTIEARIKGRKHVVFEDDDHNVNPRSLNSLQDALRGARYVQFGDFGMEQCRITKTVARTTRTVTAHAPMRSVTLEQEDDYLEIDQVQEQINVEKPKNKKIRKQNLQVPHASAPILPYPEDIESVSSTSVPASTTSSIDSIFHREPRLSTDKIFNALVQAYTVPRTCTTTTSSSSSNSDAASPHYGQRNRVNLPYWPLEDPVLQELLQFWESQASHYQCGHDARVKYLAKYLAFDEDYENIEPGDLRIRKQVTDTDKVKKYLDYLTSKKQSANTVMKSLDIIRSTLTWVMMTKIRKKSKHFLKRYTECCQAREILDELRAAWQKVVNMRVGRTTSIEAILRANRWPKDEEVRSIVNLNLKQYKQLRHRVKTGEQVSKGDVEWVLSLLCNACTIHVTFGRPSLFQKLTVGHGEQAVSSKVCGSTSFKTWSTWFIQSMYFSDGARALMQDWLTLWRPIFAGVYIHACTSMLCVVCLCMCTYMYACGEWGGAGARICPSSAHVLLIRRTCVSRTRTPLERGSTLRG
jgi:hypothetical protein